LAEPPPPELLEQLGIEPHCTCESRDDLYEHYGDVERGSIAARQYLPTGTSAKENLMRDIATATLSGNLTRDVVLRELRSGAEVARLRVATTARRRNGEEWVDKTNYFTVEVYGARARACAEHLSKGSRVLVDAELDWREWTDQQQNRREAVTFRARQIVFEGARGKAASGEQGGERDAAAADPRDSPVSAVAASGEDTAGADDLPF
jgi:single-strand DNA-binding protein